jgi:hypothetical protein
MRPLRYSINVTLDGCCDHREGIADEELHRHAVENLSQADALIFGRVTYEMMEAAWRSSTLDRVDWNAELVRGDLGKAVQQLKRESGKGRFMGGVKLPQALAELGLIDEYEFVVQPRLAGQICRKLGITPSDMLRAEAARFLRPYFDSRIASGELTWKDFQPEMASGLEEFALKEAGGSLS